MTGCFSAFGWGFWWTSSIGNQLLFLFNTRKRPFFLTRSNHVLSPEHYDHPFSSYERNVVTLPDHEMRPFPFTLPRPPPSRSRGFPSPSNEEIPAYRKHSLSSYFSSFSSATLSPFPNRGAQQTAFLSFHKPAKPQIFFWREPESKRAPLQIS